MLDMKNTMRLTKKQTTEYATDDAYRAGAKRSCQDDANATGEHLELHDCDGIVLEAFAPRSEWSHST